MGSNLVGSINYIKTRDVLLIGVNWNKTFSLQPVNSVSSDQKTIWTVSYFIHNNFTRKFGYISVRVGNTSSLSGVWAVNPPVDSLVMKPTTIAIISNKRVAIIYYFMQKWFQANFS